MGTLFSAGNGTGQTAVKARYSPLRAGRYLRRFKAVFSELFAGSFAGLSQRSHRHFTPAGDLLR